jgi:hypothetical protein
MQMFNIQVLQKGKRRVNKIMFAKSGNVNHMQAAIVMKDVVTYQNPDHESKYLIKGYFGETKQGGYAWFEADYDTHYGSEADFSGLRAVSDPFKWAKKRVRPVVSARSRRGGLKIGGRRPQPNLNPTDDDIDALIADLQAPL